MTNAEIILAWANLASVAVGGVIGGLIGWHWKAKEYRLKERELALHEGSELRQHSHQNFEEMKALNAELRAQLDQTKAELGQMKDFHLAQSLQQGTDFGNQLDSLRSAVDRVGHAVEAKLTEEYRAKGADSLFMGMVGSVRIWVAIEYAKANIEKRKWESRLRDSRRDRETMKAIGDYLLCALGKNQQDKKLLAEHLQVLRDSISRLEDAVEYFANLELGMVSHNAEAVGYHLAFCWLLARRNLGAVLDVSWRHVAENFDEPEIGRADFLEGMKLMSEDTIGKDPYAIGRSLLFAPGAVGGDSLNILLSRLAGDLHHQTDDSIAGK